MNLNDMDRFRLIDPENFLGHIQTLPGQLQAAWSLGHSLPLSIKGDIRTILIAGMGGSTIGADLLAAYLAPSCPVPIYVQRDYDLPAWADGSKTLVVASSHSGETEETFSIFEQALARRCQVLSISTGGKLTAAAGKAGVDAWTFDHKGQPRTAVGFTFGLLLALVSRLGLMGDLELEISKTIAAMQTQQTHFEPDVPVVKNPAKRMAGQLYGRWVSIIGSGFLTPVARRWKCQINEVAKALAQFEFLPEADHNTLAGCFFPPELINQMMVLFLRSPSDHPRNRLRSDLTRKGFMLEGMNTDFIDAVGDTPMAHMWTTLHYGDYVSYYLAMAYEVNPTQVGVIQELKDEMNM
ncbi:MAG: bifunctional phosphoglucose/phosphomannose isomerase [Anaerolineaceae bacterium]|nr:bifunctional phosphoglucose/phosphomannose isomerase [Anaerolineaceae bacterium]